MVDVMNRRLHDNEVLEAQAIRVEQERAVEKAAQVKKEQ